MSYQWSFENRRDASDESIAAFHLTLAKNKQMQKAKAEAKQKQRAALAELTEQAQELNMGYDWFHVAPEQEVEIPTSA